MKKLTALLALLAVIVVLPVLRGREGEPNKDQREQLRQEERQVQELMRQKLEHSHKLLEAITQDDFDKMARHANALVLLSKKAEWRVMQTPRYLEYSDQFQQAAETLAKNARDKNLDAATLSYVQMTISCTRCHNYIREVRKVRLEWDGGETLRAE
jgi:hypothetical protein